MSVSDNHVSCSSLKIIEMSVTGPNATKMGLVSYLGRIVPCCVVFVLDGFQSPIMSISNPSRNFALCSIVSELCHRVVFIMLESIVIEHYLSVNSSPHVAQIIRFPGSPVIA